MSGAACRVAFASAAGGAPGSHDLECLYPPLAPHAHGWLEAGDGHQVYWEACGNPHGAPVLFVHGGPGNGCSADDRRWFDPQRYRIVLFDQRGAGRSRPAARLVANSTAHLVRDMESLRAQLGIDRWMLFGGAWGATLALAYAQRHPARVRSMVLHGVFTATAREQRWLYGVRGAAAHRPEPLPHPGSLEGITANAPGVAADAAAPGRLLDGLSAQLHCGDPDTEHQAALAWVQWEHDLATLEVPAMAAAGPAATTDGSEADTPSPAEAALTVARIGVHFARHGFFVGEGELLLNALRLRSVPGVIVQGARDLVTPPAAALDLHREWVGSVLQFVEGTGHDWHHKAMACQLVAATNAFGTPTAPPRRRASDPPDDTAPPTRASPLPRWRNSL